jgi:hypothetical protein
MNLIIK